MGFLKKLAALEQQIGLINSKIKSLEIREDGHLWITALLPMGVKVFRVRLEEMEEYKEWRAKPQ